MLKKITEPQALYQKHHDGDASGSAQNTPEKPKKKMNMKMVGSFIAVALFLVVGVAGVAVVQRQRQLANAPVAPNAPASIPKASEPNEQNQNTSTTADNCALTYTIAPAEESGIAECGNKQAFLVTNNTVATTPLGQSGAVKPGDIIEYVVTLRVRKSANNIIVKDVLPNSLSYVEGSNAKATVSGQTLTFNLGTLTGDTEIRYRAQVNQLTAATDIRNVVAFDDDGSGSARSTSCIHTLRYTPEIVKVNATCKEKTAYRTTSDGLHEITDTGSVERNETIQYKITVTADGVTDGPVTVTDTLPAGIEYGAAVTQGIDLNGTKNADGTTTVTATIPAFGADGTTTETEVVYTATVEDTNSPGSFTNSAVVTTKENDAPACTHTVKILPTGTASCEYKGVYTASKANNGTKIDNLDEMEPGDTFWYRIGLKTPNDTTAGAVKITDVVPNSLEILSYSDDITKSGNTLTQQFAAFAPGEKPVMEFEVKIKDSTSPGTITNKATIATTGAGTDSCVVDLEIPEEDALTCNSSCESDSECKDVNSNYSCVSTSDGSRCRLTENTSSTECKPPEEVPIGCNDTCVTNADCSNPDHICYNTGSGSRCRLDSNVTSASCSTPVAQATTTPQPQQTTQPTLPQELPQTGPEDWANWLKAGLVTLGVGAVLLLLL